jgi:HK97 family phage major capsid protein
MTATKDLIQMAELQIGDLSSGGKMQPTYARRFMRILIDASEIMPLATVIPMKADTHNIDRIRFATRILRAGTSGQALSSAERSKPELSKEVLSAQLVKAEVPIPDEVLEDNIEGDRFKRTIMELMGEAIARDLDELLVNGDTASTDSFLAKFDGMLKSATTNIVNGGTVPLSKAILKQTLADMPKPYKKRKSDLVFFTNTDAEEEYADTLGDRGTPAGDRFALEDVKPRYRSIPITGAAAFPDNLGPSNNTTNGILGNPKNVTVGMKRDMKMETDRDVRAGVLTVVASLRLDFKYAYEPAIVKTTLIKVG